MTAAERPAVLHASLADELDRLRVSLRTLQAQNATLRQLVAIQDRLSALVLLGADISTITAVLAELIGRRVLLLDAQLQASAMAVSAVRFSDEASAPFRWAPAQAYVSGVLAT